jgi:hypothetical protein
VVLVWGDARCHGACAPAEWSEDLEHLTPAAGRPGRSLRSDNVGTRPPHSALGEGRDDYAAAWGREDDRAGLHALPRALAPGTCREHCDPSRTVLLLSPPPLPGTRPGPPTPDADTSAAGAGRHQSLKFSHLAWFKIGYTASRRRPRERNTRPVLTGFPASPMMKVPTYAYSLRKREF